MEIELRETNGGTEIWTAAAGGAYAYTGITLDIRTVTECGRLNEEFATPYEVAKRILEATADMSWWPSK